MTLEAKPIWDFLDEFLVSCPSCSQRATVRPLETVARLTCLACGHSRETSNTARRSITYSRSPSMWKDGDYTLGGPADPHFHLPLWLQTPCLGEVLWAYNPRHLDFLEEFVSAGDRSVRTEEGGAKNSLLPSRLPKWMQLAKNREQVLRAINKLRKSAL